MYQYFTNIFNFKKYVLTIVYLKKINCYCYCEIKIYIHFLYLYIIKNKFYKSKKKKIFVFYFTFKFMLIRILARHFEYFDFGQMVFSSCSSKLKGKV